MLSSVFLILLAKPLLSPSIVEYSLVMTENRKANSLNYKAFDLKLHTNTNYL